MSRRVGSPNASVTAATTEAKRASACPPSPPAPLASGAGGTGARFGPERTVGSLPGRTWVARSEGGGPGRRAVMASDGAALEQALGAVVEPTLALPLAETAMLRSVRTRRHRVEVVLALPAADWPHGQELVEALERVAGELGAREVEVVTAAVEPSEAEALRRRLRAEMAGEDAHHGSSAPAFLQPGSATRVVAVSSGKGGVGKSVGLLDADVYGFSGPTMLGREAEPVVLGDLVVPSAVHGVRCLSMGYFVPDDQPVIWRGPMLHKAIEQFVADCYWGRPDFLIVDTPPGTGDVTLSLAQIAPRAEVVVVTTPQPAAQRVAQRAAHASRKLKLAVRGVIENMSWFTGDDGRRYPIFGEGGGAQLAADLGVPLLGQVPLVPAVREGGDQGRPIVATDPGSEAAAAFAALAERVSALGPARVYRRELALR